MSTVKRIYRAAIVGCGRIGCFLDDDPKRRSVIWTHAGAYTACPRTKLVALVDVDLRARQAAARRWRVKRTYPNLNALFKSERIDILSLCTPSDSRASLFKQAIAADIPALWCEKPLATGVASAGRMVSLSANRVVAVNHTRRWDRAYTTAKEWIVQGGVGQILSASAWYSHGVANIGTHLFDVLRFFLGDALWVWANPSQNEKDPDPTLSGVAAFEGGVVCHVIGTGRGALFFEIDVLGTKGRLKISCNGTKVEVWTMEESARYSGYREPGLPKILWKGTDGRRMVAVVDDIVSALDGQWGPRCSAADGAKAVEMVAAFLHSVKTGRRVSLPLSGIARRRPIPVR